MRVPFKTFSAVVMIAAASAGEAATIAPTPRPDRPPAVEAPTRVATLAPSARPSESRREAPSAAVLRPAISPTARPARAAAAPIAPAANASPADAAEALAAVKGAPSPRPAFVPERFELAPAALSPRNRPGLGVAPGGLCGDARLSGNAVPEVVGAGACGIERPVRLTAVSGVSLTKPVTVGCGVARRLADWIESSARPAAARTLGAELVALDTFAGYSCRPRNNRPGARLSLHGMGQAVDVGGFRLSDGRLITVSDHWRGAGDKSAFLKSMWRTACGPFGTVLGPGSDGYHENHFHFDVAKRRTPYCR